MAASASPERDGPARVRGPLGIEEREVERPNAAGDEHVVRHLVLWTQDGETDDEREQRVPGRIAPADRLEQRQERERRERGDEQLAVVARLHQRRDDAGELVRQSANERGGPFQAERPEEQVHRPSGQNQVQREPETHPQVHRQDPAQPRGGIEDVPMHRGDERQARRTDTDSTGGWRRSRGTFRRRTAESCSPPRTGRRPAESGRREWASKV